MSLRVLTSDGCSGYWTEGCKQSSSHGVSSAPQISSGSPRAPAALLPSPGVNLRPRPQSPKTESPSWPAPCQVPEATSSKATDTKCACVHDTLVVTHIFIHGLIGSLDQPMDGCPPWTLGKNEAGEESSGASRQGASRLSALITAWVEHPRWGRKGRKDCGASSLVSMVT